MKLQTPPLEKIILDRRNPDINYIPLATRPLHVPDTNPIVKLHCGYAQGHRGRAVGSRLPKPRAKIWTRRNA